MGHLVVHHEETTHSMEEPGAAICIMDIAVQVGFRCTGDQPSLSDYEVLCQALVFLTSL